MAIGVLGVVALGTWAAICGERKAPPPPSPPGGEESLLRPDSDEAVPVGTQERPLDQVVVWLAKRSGLREIVARGLVPVRLLDGETGEKLAGVAAGERLLLTAEAGTGRVIARGKTYVAEPSAAGRADVRAAKAQNPPSKPRARIVAFERRRAVLRLVPEGSAGIRLGGARYPGELVVRAREQRLTLVNRLDVEEYLTGVVPGEIPDHFAPEAQKALAVAARTYALMTRERHLADDADLCDGPHCQNYVGILPWAPAGKKAVEETRGLLAWHDDTPIRCFYSADCGGRTSNNEDVPFDDNPRRPLPYLRSVRDRPDNGGDDYCAGSGHRNWSRDLTAARLEVLLNLREETRIGRLVDVRFTRFDAAGRVKRVRLTGLVRPGPVDGKPFIGPPGLVVREVDGWQFRRSVGWRTLKSTMARLKRPERDVYRFVGRGFGHGVGLCQIGANGMASAPHHRSFREILAHYYPGTTVAPLARRVGRAEPDRRFTRAQGATVP